MVLKVDVSFVLFGFHVHEVGDDLDFCISVYFLVGFLVEVDFLTFVCPLDG